MLLKLIKSSQVDQSAVSVSFYGGVGRVTGANFVFSIPAGKIMVDCGLVQGEENNDAINRAPFAYDPSTIKVLFVTHAHMDHIGRIPKLIKDGFKGLIYSTDATKDLARVMLENAYDLMVTEARQENKSPWYDKKDLQQAFSQWQTIDYGVESPAGVAGVTSYLYDAGHILGSAMVRFSYQGKNILFTGDLGNSPMPLLRDTEYIKNIDYVVMESVYGDRNHEEVEGRKQKLKQIIEITLANQGVLMIPAFSLERTQELLAEINDLVENNLIPRVPIFLDSPLAIKATEIYQRYHHYFNQEARDLISAGDDLFSFPGLRITETSEQSKTINMVPPPKIIIAGSGMSHGGRIIHHEKRYLSDPHNTLLLVGYQAVGTLGRLLQQKPRSITLNGQKVAVRAKIESLTGYSGHRDSDHLIEFAGHFQDSVKKVFCVMGETKASTFLVQRLRDYLGINAVHPKVDQTVTLEW